MVAGLLASPSVAQGCEDIARKLLAEVGAIERPIPAGRSAIVSMEIISKTPKYSFAQLQCLQGEISSQSNGRFMLIYGKNQEGEYTYEVVRDIK